MITGTGLKITHKNISLIFQLITTSHFHKVGKDPLVVVDERSYVVQVLFQIVLAANILWNWTNIIVQTNLIIKKWCLRLIIKHF